MKEENEMDKPDSPVVDPETFKEQFQIWQGAIAEIRSTESYGIGIQVDEGGKQLKIAVMMFNDLMVLHNHLATTGNVDKRLEILCACLVGALSDYSRAVGLNLVDAMLDIAGQPQEPEDKPRIMLLS